MIEQAQNITYHTVTLGPLTREGDALAEIVVQDEAGGSKLQSVRVPAGLPGEVVTIAVEAPLMPPTGKRRRRWKVRPPRVWITELHQPSPLRVEALCGVFGSCGGCQLQHMHYEAQLAWKLEIVRQLLQDIGGFADAPLLPTVPCDNPWHYRNHMRFSVNRSGQPGLTVRNSHRVLPLTACPIAHAQINQALDIVSQRTNPQPQVLIRCGATTHQMLMQPQQPPEVAQRLAQVGIELCAETMEEQLGGETFRIRPSSFFQTNTAQAEKMAQMVLHGLLISEAIPVSPVAPTRDATTFPGITDVESMGNVAVSLVGATGEAHPLTVVDAYCGVGTFARLLARHVAKVIAIEESASAIKDAQWNMRDVANVEICKGKVEDLLPALSTSIDGFVIDPPRAGCQPIVLDVLLQHPVARIVYVSCDPATLARDLNILCHQHETYRLRSVQPLDMFPHTAHIECVAVLEHCPS